MSAICIEKHAQRQTVDLLEASALEEQLSELRIPGGSDKLRREGKALIYKTLQDISLQHEQELISSTEVETYLPVYDRFAPHITKLRKKLLKIDKAANTIEKSKNIESQKETRSEQTQGKQRDPHYLCYFESESEEIMKSFSSKLLYYPGCVAAAFGVGILLTSAFTWDLATFELGRWTFMGGVGGMMLGTFKACFDFMWNAP